MSSIIEEVLNALNLLKNKISAGIDELTLETVCNIADIIIKPNTHLLNQFLFQDNLNKLHEKSDTNNVDIRKAKLYEKVVGTKIRCYLETKTDKSTETSCFDLLDFIQSRIGETLCVVAIFFDLSKAFDTISSSFLSWESQLFYKVDPVLYGRQIFGSQIQQHNLKSLYSSTWRSPRIGTLSNLIYVR